MEQTKKVYTLEEVGRFVGVGVRTVREHVKRGKLKAAKIGRAYRVTPERLQEYLDRGTGA
jgi:excisionase family DNA binding protein